MRRTHPIGTSFRTKSRSCATVAIVGRTRHYRDCLLQALSSRGGFLAVDVGSGAISDLGPLIHLAPDIVLFNLAEAELRPFIRRVRRKLPDARLIALDVEDREALVLPLLEAGLTGLVFQDGTLGDLFLAINDALRDALHRRPANGAELLARLSDLANRRPTDSNGPQITIREQQILKLVDSGLTNKEIARRLNIEVATVKNHVHNILDKLSVHHRGEAAARMRDGGIRLAIVETEREAGS